MVGYGERIHPCYVNLGMLGVKIADGFYNKFKGISSDALKTCDNFLKPNSFLEWISREFSVLNEKGIIRKVIKRILWDREEEENNKPYNFYLEDYVAKNANPSTFAI